MARVRQQTVRVRSSFPCMAHACFLAVALKSFRPQYRAGTSANALYPRPVRPARIMGSGCILSYYSSDKTGSQPLRLVVFVQNAIGSLLCLMRRHADV
jgi:hypothetical protein